MIKIGGFMKFEVIATMVYFITILYYTLIEAALLFLDFLVNGHTTIVSVFIVLIFFIHLIFPLPLAIRAHKNKRNIKKYFHLCYMVFAPMLLVFFAYGYDTTTKDINSIVFLTMIIVILSIPPLFVLRNCYLWYRDKKVSYDSY
ncbi:hypothetical protein LS72_007695 [Helicobacter apodemus]|uniref:Uncharacterized protein n=1 Tax=Helicobacter apodemus TaxID=135569 RepID=A0A4U8UDK9_9HELI|nr:hypothetical protein [Helicobacter apodemus]TLE14995.1 hypothetical protein LS72_007695 [Helicobacter apodemus]